jgi:protein-S-isoprenylcysteine O-methyltransferase Ste14
MPADRPRSALRAEKPRSAPPADRPRSAPPADRPRSAPPAERPRSATNFLLALLAMGVGAALILLIAPWHAGILAGLIPYAALVPCAGIVVVIALAEFLRPDLRPGSARALARAALRPLDLRRVARRLLGLSVTLAGIALIYWLLPEYHGSFYLPYWAFLRSVAPLAVLVPWYFAWADRRLPDARDEYDTLGSWLLGARRPGDGQLLARHAGAWAVKGFFLPLMTVYLNNELHSLYVAMQDLELGIMPLYNVCYHWSYAIDLLFCVVGYSCTLKLFDAEVRSVEPTVAGWLVALVCYQPFYSVIGQYYLQYEDATFWDNWLQSWPVLKACWALCILALLSIYALCTVSFGLRFSNLTNRGIITAGPYRFSKHPAYLAKNLSWWLVSVPFVSEHGGLAALRDCCLLALLNGVYYLRARTEERHLSQDPAYVAYAEWINERGLLRGLARLAPALRFRAPVVKAPAP